MSKPVVTGAVDTSRVVAYLSYQFRMATQQIPRDDEGSRKLKQLQIEFSYLIDNVERGPVYQFSQSVADVNSFIRQIKPA